MIQTDTHIALACSSGDGCFPRRIWETGPFIRKGSIFEISQFFPACLPLYAVFKIAWKEKKINLFLIWTHKFEPYTQCEEWKFLFWVEFEHSFSKFGGHTVIIYIMLRYANSFLWKLEKAGDFKSQMEFLLRKHRTFENPISPSACNIFEVFLCIIAMVVSLDHILYCLLHNSTPSSKAQLFTLSVGKDLIPFPLALIWLGKCAAVVASWQKLHRELHVWFETPFFLKPSAESSVPGTLLSPCGLTHSDSLSSRKQSVLLLSGKVQRKSNSAPNKCK